LRGKVDCSDLTDALPVSLDATASGYPDYELRATARETKEHGISPPLLAARFRPAAGSFALEEQNASSPAALEENFFWHAEGALVGLSSTPALQHSNTPTLLHSPFWLPKEWDLALHQRKGALFLNEGYPLTLDEEFAFELPTKVQVFELPGLAENDQEPLRWRIEWANGSGTLTARFTAELARGELSLAETSRFQMQLRALMFALAASAGVSLPGSNLSRSP